MEKIKKINLSIYDLDNTLVKGNTLENFVIFLIRETSNNRLIFFLVFIFLKIRLLFVSKFLKKSKLPLLIKQLKGVPKSEIEKNGKKYINTKINFNKIVLEELENDIKNNLSVYIISGTIKEILDPILGKLKVPGFSSELKYENEICQGKLSLDLRGKKDIKVDEILKSSHAVELTKFTTDNIEDQPLAHNFSIINAIVLNSKNKKFWKNYTDNIFDFGSKITLNNFHYLLPGYYYFKERTNLFTFIERLFFIFLMLLLIGNVKYFKISLLIWYSFITIYEIGYIDNDFFAIRNEKNPSIRLSEKVKKIHVFKFILIRLIYFIILCILMYYFLNSNVYKFYIIINITILIVFLIHNRLKREKRFITYSVLKLSHFYIPLFAYMNIKSLILGLLIFYLPYHLYNYLRKFKSNEFFLNPIKIFLLQTIVIILIILLYNFNFQLMLVSLYLYLTQNLILFLTKKKL